MKEDLDLLIEENFISAIEKLPSPNEKNIALHQGNEFIDVYKTFFGNHYGRWIKELLPLPISCTSATASTFVQWYIGVTDTDETELNIGMCEVHKCNVNTMIWSFLLNNQNPWDLWLLSKKKLHIIVFTLHL